MLTKMNLILVLSLTISTLAAPMYLERHHRFESLYAFYHMKVTELRLHFKGDTITVCGILGQARE